MVTFFETWEGEKIVENHFVGWPPKFYPPNLSSPLGEEDWCVHFPVWSTSLVSPETSPALLNLSLNQVAVLDSGPSGTGEESNSNAMEVVPSASTAAAAASGNLII